MSRGLRSGGRGFDVSGEGIEAGRPSVIDDFEDQDISEYGGDTGSASIETSSPITDAASLQLDTDTSADHFFIASTSGLHAYPKPGDVFEARIRAEDQSEGSVLFGVQTEGSAPNGYAVVVQFGDTTSFEIEAHEDGGTGKEDVASTTGISRDLAGTDLRVEVEWDRDDNDEEIVATLFDSGDSQVAEIAGTPSTHTFGAGGLGWLAQNTGSSAKSNVYDHAALLDRPTGSTATVMDDFNDGSLNEWDRVDSPWSAQTTHVFEGSHAIHADNESGGTVVIIATEGSLSADFAPDDVWHFVYTDNGTQDNLIVYFAKQDTSLGASTYRLEIRTGDLGSGGAVALKVVDGDGNSTTLYEDTNPLPMPTGEWGHCYVMWDPTELSSDPVNTGDEVGDVYVELQDENGVPAYSAYMDVDDTTFRDADSNGVGFRLGDGQEYAVDLLEVAGSPDAYPAFTATDHLPDTGEIAFFKTADVAGWDASRNLAYRLTDAVDALVGDYVLEKVGGTNFDELASAPSNGTGEQKRDLPNYLPDGERGRVSVQTDMADTDEAYVGCAAADDNNYARVELDYGNDRWRVLEFVGGSASVLYENSSVGWWEADGWFEVEFDRTPAGDDVTFILTDPDGNEEDRTTETLDSSLTGNDGVVIGGSNAGGATFYFDRFENLS